MEDFSFVPTLGDSLVGEMGDRLHLIRVQSVRAISPAADIVAERVVHRELQTDQILPRLEEDDLTAGKNGLASKPAGLWLTFFNLRGVLNDGGADWLEGVLKVLSHPVLGQLDDPLSLLVRKHHFVIHPVSIVVDLAQLADIELECKVLAAN